MSRRPAAVVRRHVDGLSNEEYLRDVLGMVEDGEEEEEEEEVNPSRGSRLTGDAKRGSARPSHGGSSSSSSSSSGCCAKLTFLLVLLCFAGCSYLVLSGYESTAGEGGEELRLGKRIGEVGDGCRAILGTRGWSERRIRLSQVVVV